MTSTPSLSLSFSYRKISLWFQHESLKYPHQSCVSSITDFQNPDMNHCIYLGLWVLLLPLYPAFLPLLLSLYPPLSVSTSLYPLSLYYLSLFINMYISTLSFPQFAVPIPWR
eukprot:sb/3477079/